MKKLNKTEHWIKNIFSGSASLKISGVIYDSIDKLFTALKRTSRFFVLLISLQDFRSRDFGLKWLIIAQNPNKLDHEVVKFDILTPLYIYMIG